jgi:hypothetical protein
VTKAGSFSPKINQLAYLINFNNPARTFRLHPTKIAMTAAPAQLTGVTLAAIVVGFGLVAEQ